MKKINLIVMTLTLSVAMLCFFNPDVLGNTKSGAIGLAFATVIVPFASFLMSFLWNIILEPVCNKISNPIAKKAFKVFFAPAGK